MEEDLNCPSFTWGTTLTLDVRAITWARIDQEATVYRLQRPNGQTEYHFGTPYLSFIPRSDEYGYWHWQSTARIERTGDPLLYEGVFLVLGQDEEDA